MGGRIPVLADLPEVIGIGQGDTEVIDEGSSSPSDPHQSEREVGFIGSVLLRNTLMAIGVLVAAVFLVFLVVRKRVPRN